MTDIVERIRRFIDEQYGDIGQAWELLDNAADEIERLRHDFERLSSDAEKQSLADDAEIMGLRADVERLWAAIERHRRLIRDGKPDTRSDVEGGIDRVLWSVLETQQETQP